MSFAKTTLDVRTGDGHSIMLLEPLTFTRPNGEVITAPAGTVSDGASTPKTIWTIIPPFGSYWLATVLHDYLYRLTKRDRAECDQIMMEAMISLGVPFLLRNAIYEGVRLGGAIAFNDDRRTALHSYAVSLGKRYNLISGTHVP